VPDIESLLKEKRVFAPRPGDSRTITYGELHREVCRFAKVLKGLGVAKGDRVALYLPMIPELAIAMLACTRIGAPHSIVFGGFSADALRDRINDAGAKGDTTTLEDYSVLARLRETEES